MNRNNEEGPTLRQRDVDVEQELLRLFLKKERPVPDRPPFSRTSTIIVRKELLPFYYAIYDHDLSRFVELQYRNDKDGPLISIHVPLSMQPPRP